MKRGVTNLSTAALLTMLTVTGCKTVVRENIISTVETGIGVTLAENPRTEMYEVKVGFIRSQFYSVPTGKVVENEDRKNTNRICCTRNQKDMRSNRADLTPELVSGIKMSTSAKHLFLGTDVSENFAVGKVAARSPAAVAMYIANANSDKVAAEAAKAVNPVAVEQAKMLVKAQDLAADEVIKKIYPIGDQLDKDQLKKAIRGTALEEQFESISKLSKTQFNKRLHGTWSDLAIEMKANLSN